MNNSTNPSQTGSPSLYDLMEKVLSNTTLSAEEKINLIDELRKNNPAASDRWAPRVAIWILGLAVLTTIICITYLSHENSEISEGLIAIGSAAAGGLAGLLSQVQRTTGDNQF
ncbi:hypothetical protein FLJC2902T_13080 [Flavobacterium limnosediminis JC2902]|uniref:Transmembrane protein n=1 Tax=Flavobacterium limnosediminis JC2902 TaxID=1341181 RepID=V6SRB3_9FLAO|nr:hypothetical protein [Flavobacterium limnosediminis]ESU28717.1 hypothetical protein FLJC2902T_13080 [Flavobacterium limnosediminis JC2902]